MGGVIIVLVAIGDVQVIVGVTMITGLLEGGEVTGVPVVAEAVIDGVDVVETVQSSGTKRRKITLFIIRYPMDDAC